jgi:uncharacterized membrane protein
MRVDPETKRLKRKRRRATTWGFAIPFILLLGTGGGFIVATFGAIFFSVIARMTVTDELEAHNRTIYIGGKKYGRN